jgi:hypothetical protein
MLCVKPIILPRKMQIMDASDLAAKAPNGLDITSVTEEVEDFITPGKTIRCPCGSSLPTEFMIQVRSNMVVIFYSGLDELWKNSVVILHFRFSSLLLSLSFSRKRK